MNSQPLTLEEELSIRAYANEIWQMTWSENTGLDAKKAFIEGFCIACAAGAIGVKEAANIRRREGYQSIVISSLLILVALLIYF